MFNRIVSCVLLVSFMMLLFVSCSDEQLIVTEDKSEISDGQLHNELARAFLKVRPERHAARLDEDQNYLNTFIESSREVYKEMGIDVELNRDVLNEFLELNNTMKEAGIWDAFNPLAYSPPEVIDYLRDTGLITNKDARQIHVMLNKVKEFSFGDLNKDLSTGGLLLLSSDEIDDASPYVMDVKAVLENSITLWEEVFDSSGDELVTYDLHDPDIVAAWWKTLSKIVASALGDAIVFSVTTSLTWSGPVIVFFTTVASLAVYEAFDERGW